MEKIGFAMILVGLGGLGEAYDNVKQIIISLFLIGLGALLMRIGYEKNGDRHPDRGNILDRLQYLPR